MRRLDFLISYKNLKAKRQIIERKKSKVIQRKAFFRNFAMKIPIGNCFCFVITTFEQVFLNGLWASWGMMANILKREGYFEDSCIPSEIEGNF